MLQFCSLLLTDSLSKSFFCYFSLLLRTMFLTFEDNLDFFSSMLYRSWEMLDMFEMLEAFSNEVLELRYCGFLPLFFFRLLNRFGDRRLMGVILKQGEKLSDCWYFLALECLVVCGMTLGQDGKLKVGCLVYQRKLGFGVFLMLIFF